MQIYRLTDNRKINTPSYRLTGFVCYRNWKEASTHGKSRCSECPGVIGDETGETVDPNDPVAVAAAARKEQQRISEAKKRCETQIAMQYLCATNVAEKGILVNTGGDNGTFLPGFSIFAVAGKKLVPEEGNIWLFGNETEEGCRLRAINAIPIIQDTLNSFAVFVDKITNAEMTWNGNKIKCNNAFMNNLLQNKSKKIGEI